MRLSGGLDEMIARSRFAAKIVRAVFFTSAMVPAAVAQPYASAEIEENLEEKPPIHLGGAMIQFAGEPASIDLWKSLPRSIGPILVARVGPDGLFRKCDRRGAQIDVADAEKLCADLLEKGRVGERDTFFLGGRNGILGISKRSMSKGMENGTRPGGLFRLPWIASVTIDERSNLDYEKSAIPDELRLTLDDGELQSGGSYPSRALRMELEANVSVVLGVDSRGRVVLCRPTSTSGWAFFDWAVCRDSRRYSRFRFSSQQPEDAPIRFLETSFTYRLSDPDPDS